MSWKDKISSWKENQDNYWFHQCVNDLHTGKFDNTQFETLPLLRDPIVKDLISEMIKGPNQNNISTV